MTTTPFRNTRWSDAITPLKRGAATTARLMGAPRTELCLVAFAAVVVLIAAGLQLQYGRTHSDWFIYDTRWFRTLLLLLGTSVACAAWTGWPWRRRDIGFVTARLGLLIVLAGSFLNYWSGVEGEILLAKGEAAEQLAIAERCQVTASWSKRTGELPYVFSFESGPVDWKEGAELNLGSVDGMTARVLHFYRRGKPVETWCADKGGGGGPLVRFRLEGPGGSNQFEHFLVDQDFGAELFFGPIALRLQRAASDAMLADFLRPTHSELGEKGMLSIYYRDHAQLTSVDEHVGKTIRLGDSGIGVELVHYLDEAKLNHGGQFQPIGSEPRNPLVELLVHMPNESKPYRQVAFAKSPLLNLDGVYERVCPVKFAYQHPQIEPAPAIELMQDRDGKLYARTTERGAQMALGHIAAGSQVEFADGFTFTVTEYLPHALRQIAFEPASQPTPGQLVEPAAHVEITTAGVTNDAWLQRNHPEFQWASVETPEGELSLRFDNVQIPLGFSIRLIDFYGVAESQRDRSTVLSGVVRLTDEERHVEEERQISLSQPLTHRGFTMYQGKSRDSGHGKRAVSFHVSYQPGRGLKLVGAWLIGLSFAATCLLRTRSARRTI